MLAEKIFEELPWSRTGGQLRLMGVAPRAAKRGTAEPEVGHDRQAKAGGSREDVHSLFSDLDLSNLRDLVN